ncbi:RNA polymerase sigma factor SigJ [Spirillospora sp. NBC_00431]
MTDFAERTFQAHRGLLFTLAYDIVGSVDDAEDVVQETWLRWAEVDHSRIERARAYLTRIAVREGLRRLRIARQARERYAGPWLPEPWTPSGSPDGMERFGAACGAGGVEPAGGDPADGVVRTHNVSQGLMIVLETLSPLERTAFVLREAFGYEHAEIARILDRSPEAVRQLVHRAREHVQARRPRFSTEPETARAAAERFLHAAFGGDLAALLEVLAPDVTLWTDGGGQIRAALHPIRGRDKVARFCAAVGLQNMAVGYRWMDDSTAIVLAEDAPIAVVTLIPDDSGARIREVHSVLNPDKLDHVLP